MTTLTSNQLSLLLSHGLFVVCDGGAHNNQSPDRQGYGSFIVFRDGDSQMSTYEESVCYQHEFDFGHDTNSVAEVKMMEHALLYCQGLIQRGWKGTINLGSDSQNAILAATTKIKKPAPHLVVLYQRVHKLALEMKEQVQIIKLDNQDVKRLLGH